ncbi:Clavaminate synthase-like protein [Leucosporidium creatinivorum]|uniref:Clavaminate synthase-like protein n=1 Tax=Leucosporidium creatinivorum TaxID=106004 RepID=A0A1Y2FYJ3_9BASI|nr:Clavaminate synthase-like protein [Leucosporidium creatinivorum]
MAPSALDVRTWTPPPATQEKLDYAELAQVDLSKWPAKKDELLLDMRRAVNEVGFWFVVGHGITDEEIGRQMSLGNAFLDLPLEEKRLFPCDFKQGNFFGFREGVRLMGKSQVKDNAEALNLPKITPSLAHELPGYDFIAAHQVEIEAFQRKIHSNVLAPLLSLFALLLELPESYFLTPHEWDRRTEDHLRYMKYRPNSPEDDRAIGNIHLNGHTDFGLVTILFPQIVQGLQILTPEGEWKYAPYLPNGLLINTADVLSVCSAGYFKSTIHRVLRPPDDQVNYERMGVFYFSRAAHDLELKVAPSPLLKRLGLYKEADPNAPVVSGLEFTRARVKHSWDRPVYGDDEYKKGFKVGGLEVRTDYDFDSKAELKRVVA